MSLSLREPTLSARDVAAEQSSALVACAVAVRPPVGHLRVVDAVGGGRAACPYLEARCKVVRIDGGGLPLGSYHAILGDTATLRPDDTDVLLWDGAGTPTPRWLASRLAPGGILVVPASLASRLKGLGLQLEPGEEPGVTIAFDPRPRPHLPAALSELDRTMCVDRSRVLSALREPSWRGPIEYEEGASDAHAHGARLLGALRQQLAAGEPDVRTLPWPTAVVDMHDAPGCDVLAIMPHPDDETIYSGGTLCGLARAGQRVHLVVATDGAGGRGGPGLGSRRAAELIAACEVLGVRSVRCLAWADTGKYRDVERSMAATAGDALHAWTLDRSLGDIVASIRQHRPRTLLSLGPEVDPNLSLHGHHLAVGLLVAIAFHLAALPEFRAELGPAWAVGEHRVMESPWVATGAGTTAVPIDPRAKLRALRCHRSQEYSTRRLVGRLEGGVEAETTERTRRVQARRRERWDVAAPVAAMPPFASAPPEGWAARAMVVSDQMRHRSAMLEVLHRQSSKLPPDAARAQSLVTLQRSDAVVVVTGQQVGWLGGPAYTLVKALAAVELARRISAEGAPTIPVFWMATSDHDSDEIATAPTLDGPAVRLTLEDTGGPVGDLELPADVEDARERWIAQLPKAARAAGRRLSASYRAGQTLATAFAETLAELTAGTGLLILDPAEPSLARLARPVFERELLGDEPARATLLQSPQPQVVPVDRDVTQLFYVDDEGRRQRLTRSDVGASWGGGSLDRSALAAALAETPERFSPAALLRPIVQDHLLPVVATVAGPTECRYLAQMQGLYEWAELVPSHVVQRRALHPISATDVRTLEACGGLDTLRVHPQPATSIGVAGLPSQTRAWLARCDALSSRMFAGRARLRAGLAVDIDGLRETCSELSRDGDAALMGLRSAHAWPAHAAALAEVFAGPVSARALTRGTRRLFQVRRSLLRDGRRLHPDRMNAWRRVQRDAERRMSTLELCARWGPHTVRILSAAFASLDTRAVELFGGEC